MPTNLAWSDIAIRLLCTIVAGGLIGFNRGEHGRPAGLRTTLLVALAACLAMIQVNLLLPTAGRPANSFVMNDLMRMKQDHLGKLSIVADSSGPGESDIRASLAQAGVRISSCAFAYSPVGETTELNCDLIWRTAAGNNQVPEAIHALAKRPGLIKLAWTPQPK